MHAVIFVIDAADQSRLNEMMEEFKKCSTNPGIAGKPFLIFANKQDLPTALSEVELATKLNLPSLDSCSHNIMKCIAKASANGGKVDPTLQNGLLWIIDTLDKSYEDINNRVTEAKKKADSDAKKIAEERKKRVEEFKKLSPEEQQRLKDEEKKKREAEAEADIPMCCECNKNQATRKCEASNWKPVCDDCYNRLTSVATPPPPPQKAVLPELVQPPTIQEDNNNKEQDTKSEHNPLPEPVNDEKPNEENEEKPTEQFFSILSILKVNILV